MINATQKTAANLTQSQQSHNVLRKSLLALTIGMALTMNEIMAKDSSLTDSKIENLNTTLNLTNSILTNNINIMLSNIEHNEDADLEMLVKELLLKDLNEEYLITIMSADKENKPTRSEEAGSIDTADIKSSSTQIKLSEAATESAGFSLTTILASVAGVSGIALSAASKSDNGGGGGAIVLLQRDDINNTNQEDTSSCSEGNTVCGDPELTEHNGAITTGCGDGMIYTGSKQVRDFTLTDIENNQHTLSELLANKKVLVNFFSSGCLHCKEGLKESTTSNEITAQGDVIILHIEMNEETEQEEADSGIDKFDFTSMHNGSNQLVFNLNETEIAKMSAYTAIEELDTCGWPGLYSINSEFDMIGIDRDRHSVEEIYRIIYSHTDLSKPLITPNNHDVIYDTDSIVYKSMAKQIKYMDTAANDGIASNWTLTDIKGTEHTLSDYLADGNKVIIEFFALADPRAHTHVDKNYLDKIKSDYDDVTVFRIEAMQANQGGEAKVFPDNASESNLIYIDLLDPANSDLFSTLVFNYILGNNTIGNYGLTEVPAIFFINSDNQFVKIASEELHNFTDHNHMYSELHDFNHHYDQLLESIDENDFAVFTDHITFSDLQYPDPDQKPWTHLDINGKEISLESILDSGKIVVIEHFATWCPACVTLEESGLLSDLAKNYSDKISVVMIEASSRSSREDLDDFLENHHSAGTEKIFIETLETKEDYGLEYYPTLHAINTEGEMIHWSMKRGEFSSAEELYKELLNFEALTTTI